MHDGQMFADMRTQTGADSIGWNHLGIPGESDQADFFFQLPIYMDYFFIMW